jgi:hypothetical protein
MRLAAALAILVCAGPQLPADSFSDLKANLTRLTGGEAVKATLDVQFWRQVVDDKKPTVSQGKASAQVEDGPSGVRIGWSRGLLQQAQAEARAQAVDPDKTIPTRNAMESLGPVSVAEYLNYADALLREFERAQAKVQEERQETWNGRSARLLVLKVEPRIPSNQKKYIKDLKVDARLWIGTDGLPLAYATSVKFKGSRFFISFEGSNSEELRFVRAGNRLVAAQVSSENSNSGFGQQSQRKSTSTLTVN